MRQLQQKSSALLVCWNGKEASMANRVDPDQTAPIGAVCSGSTLFASTLNSSVMLGNYLQQTTSTDDIFRCIFFLAALRVKNVFYQHCIDLWPYILYTLYWCIKAVIDHFSDRVCYLPYPFFFLFSSFFFHASLWFYWMASSKFELWHVISNNVAFWQV